MSALSQTNALLDHLNRIGPHSIDGRLKATIEEFSCSLENLRVIQEDEEQESDRIVALIA